MPESPNEYVSLDGHGHQTWIGNLMNDAGHRRKVIVFSIVAVLAVGVIAASIYYVKNHQTPIKPVNPTTPVPTTTSPATTSTSTTAAPTTTKAPPASSTTPTTTVSPAPKTKSENKEKSFEKTTGEDDSSNVTEVDNVTEPTYEPVKKSGSNKKKVDPSHVYAGKTKKVATNASNSVSEDAEISTKQVDAAEVTPDPIASSKDDATVLSSTPDRNPDEISTKQGDNTEVTPENVDSSKDGATVLSFTPDRNPDKRSTKSDGMFY